MTEPCRVRAREFPRWGVLRSARGRTRVAVLLLGAAVSGCQGGAREWTPAERAEPGPVFLLGFDGLTPELVERFEGEGVLPNFTRLRAQGAMGRIRSTIPMISPPAWTTVATGTAPADHGIWSFWIPQGEDPRGRFVDSRARLAPTLWEDLTASGRTVGVVNVPITCPPDSVNGFMIAGFPYPEGAPLTWPPDLENDVTERGYLRDAWLGPPAPGQESDWLRQMRTVGERRREIGLDLLFERKPEFSFIVFTTPDRIQHHLWKFHDPQHPLHDAGAAPELRNAIRDIYVWCDEILGEVMGQLPHDGTLLVVSDHGFGPAYQGISKATVLAARPGETGASAAQGSRNLFGGDFYLSGADSAARHEFRTQLEALQAPDGTPLVRAVHDPASGEIHGFGAEFGPDLVAEEAEGYLFVPGTPGGPLVGPLGPQLFSGFHRRHGIFGAYGRPIQPGAVRDCDLGDVPAIAMHLLGEAIPRRYAQNIPRNLFPPAFFVQRPMAYAGFPQDGLRKPGEMPTAPPDPQVAEQLRALGYVQ